MKPLTVLLLAGAGVAVFFLITRQSSPTLASSPGLATSVIPPGIAPTGAPAPDAAYTTVGPSSVTRSGAGHF